MVKMFNDALETLSAYDSNIKDLITEDNWNFKIQWPSMLHHDDPAWHAIQLNRFNANLISVQSYLESIGANAREEIDRIKSEMGDKTLSAIHGRLMQLLAEFNIAGPPTSAPPKINVSLRGDLTPEQETNMSVQHGFGQGPIYGPSSGPQGELGIRATDDAVNTGRISGQGYQTGQPVITGGKPLQGAGQAQPNSPEQVTTPSQNTPGTQPMSQPGSGAPNTSPQGKLAQKQQNRGK